MAPEWLVRTLESYDTLAKEQPDGAKYHLSREDWGKVKRIANRASRETRQGIYLYRDLYAVLQDGTERHLYQVGPYKFNKPSSIYYSADDERKAYAGRDEEAKQMVAHFMAFFASQTPAPSEKKGTAA
jgi:hypothetical protein